VGCPGWVTGGTALAVQDHFHQHRVKPPQVSPPVRQRSDEHRLCQQLETPVTDTHLSETPANSGPQSFVRRE
jgi:hypothetical protein